MKFRISLFVLIIACCSFLSWQISTFTPKPAPQPSTTTPAPTTPAPSDDTTTKKPIITPTPTPTTPAPIKTQVQPQKTVFTPAPIPYRPVSYPTNYFRSPLGIDLILSGTFGELRTNHFHAGIDIKTQGKENFNIYSVADGFVSRIKVSPGGYGTALYIDHPNGYTSVYAHLNTLNGNIGSYIKQRQYDLQNFEVDEKIPPGLLYVTKGEKVAKSGNTGSSGGPHLHFEIRDTNTEEPINPLLFGISIPDTRKPLITSMAVYDFDVYDRHDKPTIYPATLSGGVYKVSPNVIKVKKARIGLGLKAYDKQNSANNLNGIYSLEVLKDGVPIYSFKMNRLNFDQLRYLNSHLDYELKCSGKGLMQKCFIDPGNQLQIYENVINRGIIDLSDGLPHQITFLVKDVKGNTSTLNTTLQYTAKIGVGSTSIADAYNASFSYAFANTFDNGTIKLDFPAGSFYQDVLFKYNMRESTDGSVYSQYHKIHDPKTPVHRYFKVAIQAPSLPFDYYDKALIAYKDVKGRIRALNSHWEGTYLTAESREFGEYFVTVDLDPPVIKAINISNGKNMAANTTITMSISDKLSGIKSYNGYVDGQWVLMKYDAKNARLRYYFDERVGKGSHEFRLVVKDGQDNTQTYTANFVR